MANPSMRDTISIGELERFDSFIEQAHGDTFVGYDLVDDTIHIVIHDADSSEVIAKGTFSDNGLASRFMGAGPPDATETTDAGDSANDQQTSGASNGTSNADSHFGSNHTLNARGDIGTSGSCHDTREARDRDGAFLDKRASGCYQFCARSYSCTTTACRSCVYVGGACR